MTRIILLVLMLAFSLPLAHADVKYAGESSFTVSVSAASKATPEQAWTAMTQRIAEWWSAEHSWSGDAANFYMRAELGGCFCEHLPAADSDAAGGVEHLRIIYIKPFEVIRFDGTLGPFMDMPVQGRMSWNVAPLVDEASGEASGTTITFTYRIHGYVEGGFTGLAPVVDGVIGQQLQHLLVLLDQ